MDAQETGRSGKLASDKDRDQALELLSQAVADGRLTMAEYGQRVESALAARTFGDIDAVTHDLPDATPAAQLSPVPASEQLVAIFGNESRKGPWTVPEHLSARSIFGDCHIEMQQARLQHRVTTIDATAYFGSITVFVPDNVDVRLTGRAIFSQKSSTLRRQPPPGSPVLVVRCNAVFGSVSVRPPGRWLDEHLAMGPRRLRHRNPRLPARRPRS